MTQHSPEVRLKHMLDASRKALRLTAKKSRKDLDSDDMLTLSLERLIEIIGEAANGIPEPLRQKNPQIPWREIIGTRNHLIHGYSDVDHDIIWDIVSTNLPLLVKNLKAILSKENR